jgi:hypothetical protein
VTRALVLLLLLSSAGAHAQEPMRLDYRVEPSLAAQCWSAERFDDELSARSGARVFVSDAARVLVVSIAEFAGGVLVRAELDGAAIASARAARCDEALDQLSRSIAEPTAPSPAEPPSEPALPRVPTAPDDISVESIPVTVSSDTPLRLHVQQGAQLVPSFGYRRVRYRVAASYAPLCDTPCSVRVPRGIQQYGVSRIDGTAVAAGAAIEPPAGAHLHLAYEDRTAMRVLGWIAGVLGLAAIPISIGIGAATGDGKLAFAVGLGSGAGLLTTALILFELGNDRARIDVVPP